MGLREHALQDSGCDALNPKLSGGRATSDNSRTLLLALNADAVTECHRGSQVMERYAELP